MELSNEAAAWAALKVEQLLADCVATLAMALHVELQEIAALPSPD